MERNPGFSPRAKLVELSSSGYFTLPGEVTAAHRAATLLDDERRRPTVDLVAPARLRLADEFRLASTGEAPWPDGADLAEALVAQRVFTGRFPILEQVTAEAQSDFIDVVDEAAYAIITDHLRPVLEQVLDEAAKAGEATAAYGDSPAALLTAPKDAREAYGRLDVLADRYAALRTAREILTRTGRLDRLDAADVLGELRNLLDVWPNWRQRGEPPWPTTSAALRVFSG